MYGVVKYLVCHIDCPGGAGKLTATLFIALDFFQGTTKTVHITQNQTKICD